MSRLTEDLVNPAAKYFTWDGVNGCFEYFDKTQKTETVKGVNVPVPLPFRFLFLEKLSSIRGYNDDEKSGYYSNEVLDINKEVMAVRLKRGVVAQGLYKEVIDAKTTRGSKYCQSVYIAYKEGDKMIICNLQLVGAAVSAWIEFCKGNDIKKGAIAVETSLDKKKGTNNYKEPVFKKIKSTPESEESANVLCAELDKYLKAYLSKTQGDLSDNRIVEHVEASQPVAETKAQTPVRQVPKEEVFVADDSEDVAF
mgnify:CR=1 FL=1